MSKSGKSHFNLIFTLVMLVFTVAVLFKPATRYFFPIKYIDEIKMYSKEYNLDEHLVMAVIRTESKFNTDAVSHKNAKGLMQLREDTANWCIEHFGLTTSGDFTTPETNIQIGCSYLRYLIDKFGSIETALAAYNAGEGNVSEWLDKQGEETNLSEIPFEETRNYVNKVLKREKIYHFLY